MTTESKHADAEVMRIPERWSNALRAKDLDALGYCYADDVRVFDIGTPLVGYDKLRELWEACSPLLPKYR